MVDDIYIITELKGQLLTWTLTYGMDKLTFYLDVPTFVTICTGTIHRIQRPSRCPGLALETNEYKCLQRSIDEWTSHIAYYSSLDYEILAK